MGKLGKSTVDLTCIVIFLYATWIYGIKVLVLT
jgi:hypothetical protein